jgi:fatty-acyl-CoA synthase
VQVIGVPDETYGEEVMAWIILKPGARLTGEELADWCRGRITHFKVPRYWRFVEDVSDDGEREGAEVQAA